MANIYYILKKQTLQQNNRENVINAHFYFRQNNYSHLNFFIMKNLFSTPSTHFRKNAIVILCLTLTGLFFITGCNKEKDNDPIDNPIVKPTDIEYTDYLAHIDLSDWINLNYDEKVIIINNDEKFKTYINPTAYNHPSFNTVDFSKHSMLLVSGSSENSAVYITKKLQKLSRGKFKLDIEIFLNPVSANKNWHFAILVEKLSDESSIELKTKTSMGEADYFYGNNEKKEWFAVRKDFVLMHCKSDADARALCEKFTWAVCLPEHNPVFVMARINPLQTKLDDLLQIPEVLSAAYGLERAELIMGYRSVRFPMNSIEIKLKEDQTPEHILDEAGLTEYIEEITLSYGLGDYLVILNIELSEILRISRDLVESGLCVRAVPRLIGGVEPYK